MYPYYKLGISTDYHYTTLQLAGELKNFARDAK